jgi:hypothetical protein
METLLPSAAKIVTLSCHARHRYRRQIKQGLQSNRSKPLSLLARLAGLSAYKTAGDYRFTKQTMIDRQSGNVSIVGSFR